MIKEDKINWCTWIKSRMGFITVYHKMCDPINNVFNVSSILIENTVCQFDIIHVCIKLYNISSIFYLLKIDTNKDIANGTTRL